MEDTLNSTQYFHQLKIASKYVKNKLGTAEICIVLGSGLGIIKELLQDVKTIPFSEIPFMPVASIPGHTGELLYGYLPNTKTRILAFAGRVHCYEGYYPFQITFATRLSWMCGCRIIVFTNAAGVIKSGYKPGDIMAIKDYIIQTNFSSLSDTFLDNRFGPIHMKTQWLFSERLRKIALNTCKSLSIPTFEGVYTYCNGPAFETPSEILFFRNLGADAVGMSSIGEALAASSLGMEILGVSFFTNLAAGMSDEKLDHEDVMRESKKNKGKWCDFMIKLLQEISSDLTLPISHNSLNPHFLPSSPLPLIPSPAPSFSSLTPLSLPPIQYIEDILAVIMTANQHFPLPVATFLLPPFQDQFLECLHDIRSLPFSHLPRFTSQGLFILGSTSENHRVLVILLSHLLQLSPLESLLIALVLKKLGIKSVFQNIIAGSTSHLPSASNNEVVIVKEHLNYSFLPEPTTINNPSTEPLISPMLGSIAQKVWAMLPPPLIHQSSGSTPLFMTSLKLLKTWSQISSNVDESGINGLKMVKYLSFAGPNIPSPHQIETCQLLDCEIYGITNLSICYHCSALRIPFLLTASVGPNYNEMNQIKQLSENTSFSISQLFSGIIDHADFTKNVEMKVETPIKVESKTQLSSLSFFKPTSISPLTKDTQRKGVDQLLSALETTKSDDIKTLVNDQYLTTPIEVKTPTLTPPFPKPHCCSKVPDSSVSDGVSAISSIFNLSSLKSPVSSCLVIDSRVISYSSTSLIELDKLGPSWKWNNSLGCNQNSNHLKIGLGQIGNQYNFLIIDQPISHYENSFSCIGYTLQVLKELGVQNINFVSPFTSISPEIEIGDIIFIKDHVNFSGSNILTGPNVRGTPFFDMSNAYSPSRIKHLTEYCQKSQIPIKQSITLQVMPGIYTPVISKLAKLANCNTICSGRFPGQQIYTYIKHNPLDLCSMEIQHYLDSIIRLGMHSKSSHLFIFFHFTGLASQVMVARQRKMDITSIGVIIQKIEKIRGYLPPLSPSEQTLSHLSSILSFLGQLPVESQENK